MMEPQSFGIMHYLINHRDIFYKQARMKDSTLVEANIYEVPRLAGIF